MMTIVVPGVPPSPNELRRKYRHPMAYRKLRKQWEHDLFYGTTSASNRFVLINLAKTDRMSVQVTIHHPGTYDPDNLYGCLKPVLDALKNIGYIQNDSNECLKLLPTVQIKSQVKQTVVNIGIVSR